MVLLSLVSCFILQLGWVSIKYGRSRKLKLLCQKVTVFTELLSPVYLNHWDISNKCNYATVSWRPVQLNTIQLPSKQTLDWVARCTLVLNVAQQYFSILVNDTGNLTTYIDLGEVRNYFIDPHLTRWRSGNQWKQCVGYILTLFLQSAAAIEYGTERWLCRVVRAPFIAYLNFLQVIKSAVFDLQS